MGVGLPETGLRAVFIDRSVDSCLSDWPHRLWPRSSHREISLLWRKTVILSFCHFVMLPLKRFNSNPANLCSMWRSPGESALWTEGILLWVQGLCQGSPPALSLAAKCSSMRGRFCVCSLFPGPLGKLTRYSLQCKLGLWSLAQHRLRDQCCTPGLIEGLIVGPPNPLTYRSAK